MTPAQPAPAPRAPEADRPRHTFSTTDYRLMITTSILGPEDKVELIEGEILLMPSTGRDHTWGVTSYNALLMPHAPGRFTLQTQSTIHLAEGFSPEPDLALLKFRQDHYRRQEPTTADLLLVVEIADSSARYDLEVKTSLYARAGVPEVWVLDLTEGTLHRFAGPTPQGYSQHSTPKPGESISPIQIPDLQLQVSDLLPEEDLPA